MNNKKTLGIMADCSRNGVMSVEAVKRYAKTLSDLGFNALMLYTEDTFEVNDQPFFGYLRGRYTKAEMKELDSYCESVGVELIPCIQTLAHLNCIFKWYEEYDKVRDCDDILLIDAEPTYKLIDDMFSTLSECFKTRKIHIGMDEAYRVGLGNYLRKNGYEDRFDLINRHLHKVCEIADKYGLKPMIWSDMFCKLALNSEEYYNLGDFEAIKTKAALPESVSLVYWDYYSSDVDHYNKMFAVNKAFDRPVVFAGGAWTWKSFAPDNQFSIKNTEAALKACQQNDINTIFLTAWGDDGSECSRFAVLPTLFYTKEVLNGNSDMDSIKAKFKDYCGISFDDFLLLDKVHGPYDSGSSTGIRYMLYGDPFLGFNDFKISEDIDDYYKDLSAQLKAVEAKGDYKRIFDTCATLCDALAYKASIGVKARKFYKNGDKTALKALALNEYVAVQEKLDIFHKTLENFWMHENKPFGFEMQSIRIGGSKMRLESCRQRLIDYCEGKTAIIEELEEEIVPSVTNKTWGRIATPGVISHMV